jgi:hypothetical protein
MSRRVQELEERDRRDIDGAKKALKRLGDEERAFVLAWLCKFFNDDGVMFSPQIARQRRTVVIDDIEYWLVRRPVRARRLRNV